MGYEIHSGKEATTKKTKAGGEESGLAGDVHGFGVGTDWAGRRSLSVAVGNVFERWH